MALSNAQKQARHRARRDAELERLRAEVAALKAELAKLRATTMTVTSPLHGDRIFRRVGERDHVTRDGRRVVLSVWRSACVICGADFEVMTPKSVAGEDRSFLYTTCDAHRITASERGRLSPRWQTVEARRATFETIKAEKLRGVAR